MHLLCHSEAVRLIQPVLPFKLTISIITIIIIIDYDNTLLNYLINAYLIVLFTLCTVPVQCREQLNYFLSISPPHLASCVSGAVGAAMGGFIGGVLLTAAIGGSVSLVVFDRVKRKMSASAR